MDGFDEYRAAARAGIEAAGCEAVLIDDYPALPRSSRNACLDGVESCDAVAVVVGDRGGWTTPSAKLVVEEEFQHARGRSLPVLVFLQDVARDSDGDRLARQLSDYVDGAFRRTFRTPSELAAEVEAACRPLAQSFRQAPMNTARLDDLLAHPHSLGHEAVLRLVLAPGRQAETVIELERLDDDGFRHDIVQIGVAPEVGLFDLNEARRLDRGRDSLVVLQDDHHHPARRARMQLFEDGVLVIDIAVTGGENDAMATFSPITVDAVRECAATALRFARRLFEAIDPYGRHVGLLANASLGHRNGRTLTSAARNPHQRSVPIDITSVGRDADAPRSFDRPDRVSRTDDGWVDALALKIANRLERRVNT